MKRPLRKLCFFVHVNDLARVTGDLDSIGIFWQTEPHDETRLLLKAWPKYAIDDDIIERIAARHSADRRMFTTYQEDEPTWSTV